MLVNNAPIIGAVSLSKKTIVVENNIEKNYADKYLKKQKNLSRNYLGKKEKRLVRFQQKINKRLTKLEKKGLFEASIDLNTISFIVLALGGLFILLGIAIPYIGILFIVIGAIIGFVGLVMLLLFDGIKVRASDGSH